MVGRRLGRGLEFLLSDRGDQPKLPAAAEPTPAATPAETPADPVGADALLVPLDRLQANPYQPRETFDPEEISGLAASIRRAGILQPLLVRRKGDGYEIVAGERRARAAREAGLSEVPVVLRDVADAEMRLLALVENLQRADLDPIEKANSFRDLKASTGWTHDRIASEVGLDRSSVTNYLRLLELPPAIRQRLKEGKLGMGHARALLAAPEALRLPLAERVVRDALSVRETERLAAAPPPGGGKPAEPRPKKGGKPAWIAEMQQNLIGALGCRIAISYRNGKGRIALEIGSREEFDRIYELLMSALPVEKEDELVRQRLGRAARVREEKRD